MPINGSSIGRPRQVYYPCDNHPFLSPSTPCATTAQSPTAPSSPTPVVELPGRVAVESFSNNIDNINPADYRWVKNYSTYMLCHKKSESTSQDDSQQALLWIVDSLGLENTRPYGSWSVSIRLLFGVEVVLHHVYPNISNANNW
jgi:hypothetical protein